MTQGPYLKSYVIQNCRSSIIEYHDIYFSSLYTSMEITMHFTGLNIPPSLYNYHNIHELWVEYHFWVPCAWFTCMPEKYRYQCMAQLLVTSFKFFVLDKFNPPQTMEHLDDIIPISIYVRTNLIFYYHQLIL